MVYIAAFVALLGLAGASYSELESVPAALAALILSLGALGTAVYELFHDEGPSE